MVGALCVAFTVWPSSLTIATTVPEIGAVILVRSSAICAVETVTSTLSFCANSASSSAL